MGEADFNQFNRLRSQLVVEVRDFSKEENLPPVQVELLAKDMEEQLKLTHKAQSCRICWSTTQKDLRDYAALQCAEARDFICSSAIVWKKKRQRKIQSKCLCEL